MKKNIYSFDSSAFMTSWQVHYPPTTFSSFWDKLTEEIDNEKIIVAREVKKEIIAGNDDLKEWFMKNSKCVQEYTNNSWSVAQKIIKKYPKVSQYHKPRPFHADPFVVALAKERGAIVVTYELNNGSHENPAIPNLCDEYEIECCNMAEFFAKEKWKIKLE